MPAWRCFFEERELRQPFKQAHTEVYIITDQVRFYPLDAAQNSAHAGGGGYGVHGEQVEPLLQSEIQPLVFSEVMRDVDLFVGVANVGNDPNWLDGGPETQQRDYWQSYAFGDLSTTAATRKELLQRLVPRLKIADRCSFQDRFLVVRGDRRTYKIQLGSGYFLLEPYDRYLCIVPGRGAVTGPAAKVFLPFAGDRTLSIILSKAFLLATDARIRDTTIPSQIGGLEPLRPVEEANEVPTKGKTIRCRQRARGGRSPPTGAADARPPETQTPRAS